MFQRMCTCTAISHSYGNFGLSSNRSHPMEHVLNTKGFKPPSYCMMKFSRAISWVNFIILSRRESNKSHSVILSQTRNV